MKKIIQLFLLSLAMCLPTLAQAENSQEVGDYIVHYNALSTESLPPSVASAYRITRSKNRGLLNISVLKKGGNFEGVSADIDASATNLTGQLRTIILRQVKDQNAVYYLAEFSVADQETLDFSIQVETPDRARGSIKFRQQFFSN
jgi:hypothetical protein